MAKDWKEERKRLEEASLEERRKGYSQYEPLSSIPTSLPPPPLAEKELGKIRQDLLEDFDLEEAGDLAKKVSIFVGDITKLEIDAIVNAANNSLLGGGGVDGAIHRAAGPLLLAENKSLGGCPDGEARLSCGYKLPARYVISTVGPRGEHPDVLEAAYSNSLNLLLEHDLRSIAFPCISTGIYGYPQASACRVALRTVRRFLERNGDRVDRVIFCLFLKEDVQLYRERLGVIFPPTPRTEKTEEADEKKEDDKSDSDSKPEIKEDGEAKL